MTLARTPYALTSQPPVEGIEVPLWGDATGLAEFEAWLDERSSGTTVTYSGDIPYVNMPGYPSFETGGGDIVVHFPGAGHAPFAPQSDSRLAPADPSVAQAWGWTRTPATQPGPWTPPQ